MKRIMAAALLCMTCVLGWSQEPGFAEPNTQLNPTSELSSSRKTRPRRSDGVKSPPANPFKTPNARDMAEMMGGMGGMMGGMEEMSGMGGGDGMDMGEMEMEMMGMMGGMGMGIEPDPEIKFRQGLQRAIRALRGAKTDEERTALKGYVKTALQERYMRMIQSRRKDLENLKAKINRLEADLSRRESAAKRVIEVQMQSVELASEGLLELGELGGAGAMGAGGGTMGAGGVGAPGIGPGGMSGMGLGGGMGGMDGSVGSGSGGSGSGMGGMGAADMEGGFGGGLGGTGSN